MEKTQWTRLIKTKALSLGFNAVGIAEPELKEIDTAALQLYIHKGYHASLHYLKNNIEQRNNIKLLFPETKSVLMVLASYYPEINDNHAQFKIAYYTFSYDYHYIIKAKLGELLDYIKNEISNKIQGYIFCDTAPVFEKSYAVSAGLGWIGKHGLLIHPEFGSWVVLGGIALNVELEYDKALAMRCPSECNLCITSCPTQAIVEPKIINAAHCISYLTVENKEPSLPLKNPTYYIAGCDICQLACPFNKRAHYLQNKLFTPQAHVYWTNNEWLTISTGSFKKYLAKTSIGRIGLRTLRRNIEAVNKTKLL